MPVSTPDQHKGEGGLMERGADFAEGESDSDSDSFNKENPNQLFDSADSAGRLPEESYKAIMKKNYLYTLVSYPTYYHLAGRRKGGGGRGEGKGRRGEGEGGRGKEGESDMHSFCFLFFVFCWYPGAESKPHRRGGRPHPLPVVVQPRVHKGDHPLTRLTHPLQPNSEAS